MIVKGSQLIAYNEITKRSHATFDMAAAVAVEDCATGLSPMAATFTPVVSSPTKAAPSVMSHHRSMSDESEEPYADVPHSFRVVFNDSTVVYFYADSEAAKAKWLQVLDKMVGKPSQVPPLWAVVMKDTLGKPIVPESADATTSSVEASPVKPARPASQQPHPLRISSRNAVPSYAPNNPVPDQHRQA